MKKSIFLLLMLSTGIANAQKSTEISGSLSMNSTPREKWGSYKSETNYTATNQVNTAQPNSTENYVGMLGCDAGDFYSKGNATMDESNITSEPKKSENGIYSFAFSDLVNGMKELKNENDNLKKANETANLELKKQSEIIKSLVKKVSAIEELLDFGQK